jgi:transmembrane sensor
MDELIMRALRGEAGELELRRLHRWCAEAPANQRYYEELAAVWRASEPSGLAAPLPPPAPEASDIARRAEARRRASRHSLLRRWWIGAAAAAVLLLGAGMVMWAGRASTAPYGVAQFTAGSNDPTTATLEDGSVVRLWPGSRLSVRDWRPDRRAVDLDGRAFFAVAHDPDRPFTVRAGGGETRVLGTRFELKADVRSLRVVVVEGRVSLTLGGAEAEVSSGEVGQSRDGFPPSVIRVEDVHQLLDWPGGLLVFQATPLGQVAHEIGRRFARPVRVSDPELARRQITAWFADERLEEVVAAVCTVAAATCAIGDTLVTIAR